MAFRWSRRFSLQGVISLLLIGMVILLLAVWYRQRERLPERVRIAAGPPGSLYYTFAYAFSSKFKEMTGISVEVLETAGAIENQQFVADGRAELALFSSGAGTMEETGVIAPLYDELLHIVARKESGITTLFGLDGRLIALDAEGSGVRPTAFRLLQHYAINPAQTSPTQNPIELLKSRTDIAAAILLTGIASPDLQQVLTTGEFVLLPIEGAEAVTYHYPFYAVSAVPRGLYGENPVPIPEERLTTISAKAVFIANRSVSSLFVNTVLNALFTNDLHSQIPILMAKQDAESWTSNDWLPQASAYYEPYKELKFLKDILEPIDAAKELVLALFLGLFVLRNRLTNLRKRRQEGEFSHQKERLDEFIQEINAIQTTSLSVSDEQAISSQIEHVTRIQTQALSELTDEKLRGNKMFLLFLTLCADVSRKLEHRLFLSLYTRR